MKLHCERCKQDVELVVKMGGILCKLCRTILAYPYSEEYDKALEYTRKQIALAKEKVK